MTSRRALSTAPVLALALTLTLTLTGCGAESDSTGNDNRPVTNANIQLGLSVPNANMEFFQELLAGAEEEAEVQKVRLSVRNAKGDANQQSDDIARFTKQGVDSLVLTPVSTELPADTLSAVADADIPIVAADRAQEGAVTLVSSDNEPGGLLAAQELSTALDGSGTIAVLRGPANTTTSKDRGKGFLTGLEPHSGLEIAASEEADFDREKGEEVMSEIIAANQSITGVFAENDDMALGAAEALKAWPGLDVEIVGFDGTASGLKAVENGTFAATVAQQPAEIGKLAVRNAIRAAKGEAVEEKILVPLRVATKQNIKEFD